MYKREGRRLFEVKNTSSSSRTNHHLPAWGGVLSRTAAGLGLIGKMKQGEDEGEDEGGREEGGRRKEGEGEGVRASG